MIYSESVFQEKESEESVMSGNEPKQACVLESRFGVNSWVVLDRKEEGSRLSFPMYLLATGCLDGSEIENRGHANRKWGGSCLEWVIRNEGIWDVVYQAWGEGSWFTSASFANIHQL